MLEKIRALLDKADATTFPEEADAFRQKADALMVQYTIDQYQVDQMKGKDQRQVPIMKKITLCGAGDMFSDQLIELMGHLSRHSRCRIVLYNTRYRKMHPIEVAIVGFPADVDYVEMLYTSLRLQMSLGLEPNRDPNESDLENVIRMKEAGVKWERIWHLMGWEDFEPKKATKWQQRYTRHCQESGKERVYANPANYQRNFADGYVTRIWTRLTEMKRDQEQTIVGGSQALVLRDIGKEVNDEFHRMFPRLGRAVKSGDFKHNGRAREEGRKAGDRADLSKHKLSGRKQLN